MTDEVKDAAVTVLESATKRMNVGNYEASNAMCLVVIAGMLLELNKSLTKLVKEK